MVRLKKKTVNQEQVSATKANKSISEADNDAMFHVQLHKTKLTMAIFDIQCQGNDIIDF